MAVVAMGKLGSREMTATSDLDLLVICDPAEVEESEGPKPLSASIYYARLTQSLIAALTAQTAEGTLYPVDMRLRPSGRQGPVAVRLPAFERYQREEAWTWEHLALTRARCVAGDAAVAADAAAAIASVRAMPRDPDKMLTDVREMRARVADANRGARSNPWALKHVEGGLMDIEFAVQAGLLATRTTDLRAAGEAAPELARRGWFSTAQAATLAEAHGLMMALQQVERVALDRPFDPETAGPGLRAAMARAGCAPDFASLERQLRAAQSEAATVVEAVLAA
jgi:glutamate-ammonia-ligase adenylyltransferase